MNTQKPLIYIIILVFNGKKWIDECLKSVLSTKYSNFKVIVIDNASEDDSFSYVMSKYPQVELFKNKRNFGFAEGNNIGIRCALAKGADYVVLQNQDTKVDVNWLSTLINISEEIEEVGILSPMQYSYDGIILDENFKLLIQEYNSEGKSYLEVNRVIGASIMIKKKVFDLIGLLDPIYFCYFEEGDFCRRAIYHGFKIVVVKDSKIYHWHTLIKNTAKNNKLKRLLNRNEFIYTIKNPNCSFISNIYFYFRTKFRYRVQIYGKFKGFVRFFLFIFRQSPTYLLLPIIYFKRNKDIIKAE